MAARRNPKHRPAHDFVRHNVFADTPNELSVANITFAPMLVGWPFSADLKTRTLLEALHMALAGVKPSTGSVGEPDSNAMCESLCAPLGFELRDCHRFRSHSQARMAVF